MKKKIKDIMKLIFSQICMICFGISAINGLLIAITHNYGGETKIHYLFPLSIVICSILCGFAVIFFCIQKIPFIGQCVLHFITLVGIVTGCSFWFGWISGWADLIVVYGVLLVIYIAIWLITYRDCKINANKVNKALENNRDTE